MPQLEVIKAADAPEPPKKVAKATQEVLTALQGLKRDEVLKMEPDEGQTLRGLKTSVGRIASNAGIKVSSWSDEMAVYVKKE